MRKVAKFIAAAFAVFLIGSIVLSALAGGPDPMADAKAKTAALSADNTAKRLERIYEHRGWHTHVTCRDVSATNQSCVVKRDGKVVARPVAVIDLDTGTIDVR